MSDELPAGSASLEDDAPAAPPEPPAPPPAEEAKPAEVESVEVGGEKYVPVAALISERKQRQALSEKAATADALQAQLAQIKPYVDFIQANPQVLQPRAPEPPPAPKEPAVDPDAEEAARLMDFYRADGSLDTQKGAKWLALQDRRSGRVAQQAIQPLAATNNRDRAAINFQKAMQVKDASGATPSRESLQAVWQIMPEADLADERVAGMLAAMAHGLDRFRPPAVQPPAREPQFTETSGGHPRQKATMSDLETRVVQHRQQQTPTQWAKLTENFQPGKPNVLED